MGKLQWNPAQRATSERVEVRVAYGLNGNLAVTNEYVDINNK